ncbi:MAG: hypothetical protein QXU88_01200 [Candidatus Woesearchaeota archaeon]
MKPTIVSEKSISLYQLKEEIERMKKEDEKLNQRTLRTEDYLNATLQLTPEKAHALFEKLSGLDIPRLKEPHLHKIVELLPRTVNDLKAVLQGYAITLSAENLKKIIDIVKEFS